MFHSLTLPAQRSLCREQIKDSPPPTHTPAHIMNLPRAIKRASNVKERNRKRRGGCIYVPHRVCLQLERDWTG
ncbi:mCG66965 [Mus musculus]|nr:mCG66965 [Mus musculus]